MHLREEERTSRSSDVHDAPSIAVVNQSFVDRYFPHANPLGKKIWGNGRRNPVQPTIVGVVTGIAAQTI